MFYIYNIRNKGYYRQRDGVWTLRTFATSWPTRQEAQTKAEALMRSPKLAGLLTVLAPNECLDQARL